MAGFLGKIFNFVKSIVPGVQLISSVTSIFLGKKLEKVEEIPTRRESPLLNNYLNAPLSTTLDTPVKKAVAVAAAIAKKRGVATPLNSKSPMELASAVDEGLTRMKVAYQQGKGILDSTSAVDEIVDRAASRVASFTDRVIEKHAPIVVNTVVKAVSAVFPPARVIAPVVKAVVPFVITAAKKIVRKGIEVAAKVAKTVVKKVVTGIKKIGKSIFRFLFG